MKIEKMEEKKEEFLEKLGVYYSISTKNGTLSLLAMASWYAYNGGSHDFLPIGDIFDWPLFTIRHITITSLISASICSGIGRLFHQKGSFCNSLIGAGLGCIVGIAALGIEQKFSGDIKSLGPILFVSTTPIGALIGYNINKKTKIKLVNILLSG